MTLKSKMFSGDQKLEAAAVSNPAHILRGAIGPHVGKIQRALIEIDDLKIAKDERVRQFFGASTETATLSFKKKRKIINKSYQNEVDPIVGIMTMAELDREMVKIEGQHNEIMILCAIASTLGYSTHQPLLITNDQQLRAVVGTLQSQIKSKGQ